MCKISNYQGIGALQERHLPMNLIRVEYPTRHPSHAKDKWRTDEWFWCVAMTNETSLLMQVWQDLDGKGIVMDLLYVFLEMPRKEVSLSVERHRETLKAMRAFFHLKPCGFITLYTICQRLCCNADPTTTDW